MPQTHQNPQPQVIELGSQRVQQGLGFVEMRRGSVYSLVSQGLRALMGLDRMLWGFTGVSWDLTGVSDRIELPAVQP